MRLMNLIGRRQPGLAGRAGGIGVAGMLIAAAVLLATAPVTAIQASFDSTGIGFDPSDLAALPTATIGMTTEIFYAADPVKAAELGIVLDVALTGTATACVLTAGSSVCQSDLTQFLGDYSAIFTIDIDVLNVQDLPGEFTLVLFGMQLTDETTGAVIYDASEVLVDLDPADLYAADIEGLGFDRIFDPFVRVQDSLCSNAGGICNYIGWTVEDGDSVSFRYDSISTQGRNAPVLLFAAIPIVVPEPGSALLMGLGLIGLALGGSRSGRKHD